MEMNEVAARIAKAMEKQKISYGELARMTGIPKSAVFRYVTGQTEKVPLPRLECIARALNMEAASLMGWEKQAPPGPPDSVSFDIIGEVAAGFEHYAEPDWTIGRIDIPESWLHGRAKEDYFVLRISGDSMYPAYQDGDVVLVLKQSTMDHSGQIGVVIYESEKATLKRVEYVMGEDWMRLLPINPQYPPVTITGTELEQCKVIGVPRMVIRKLS